MASLPPINPRTSAAGPISELSVILPRLPLDSSDRRFHCEAGPEPGLALRNAVVGLRCLCQWVRLDDRFNFSLRYEIKRLVEIFGAVLLAPNYLNAFRDEIHQRDRKRLRVGAHRDEPAVRPQSLYAVHHRLGRIRGTEDYICTSRCRKALAIADNFIRAEIADHLVFIGGMRNCDSLEACGLRVLHCQVPKSADPEHSNTLMRLGIGPAEPAIDRITSAKDGGCLLIGNLVRNEIGCIGIHQHVLSVSALCLNPCALQIGTEHPAATLAPFAAPQVD